MTRVRVLALCSFGLLFALATAAWAGNELKLGDRTEKGKLGETISVMLKMTSTEPGGGSVQGLVAAGDWDGAKLQGVDLQPQAAILNADTLVRRVEPSYFVLGVVMDSDGADSEIILPGTDIPIAALRVKALGPSGDVPETVDLIFQDKKYNTVDLGPLLDNIVVIGGLSIGEVEGLVLTDGLVTLNPPPPAEFRVDSKTLTLDAGGSGCMDVPIVMGNQSPVQGFVTSVQHDQNDPVTGVTLTLSEIKLGAAAGTPDFAWPEIFATGGTLGVVMDLNDPFGVPPPIAPGSNNVIALYRYCATVPAMDCGAADVTSSFDIEFVDFVFGSPAKENVVVIGGLSKNPDLVDGTLTVVARSKPCGGLTFAVGSCELVDDPTSADKDETIPGVIRAHPGDMVQVGFYYKSPDTDDPDEAHQTDHIQGVSIAACFDPSFIQCQGTYTLAGTITEAVGAEFVNVQCENDTTDGDPGEIVIGIMVDALPPFDGQTLPPTDYYLKLICVDFQIAPNAPCNQCSPIQFCCANGRGTVPVRNLASIDYQAVEPILVNGEVCIIAEPTFIRGDCNFSGKLTGACGPQAVDISDAAAVIGYLFMTGSWQFHPLCLDACDANDDGRIDLADSVYILRYLFKFDREPKAPFPDPGEDPTPDRLTCEGGSVCL